MKNLKKVLCFLLAVMIMASLTACGSNVTIDYADAESFEAALNRGEDLEGKVVQFVAGELHPDSVFGYDIWAGEHLNFVSTKNPNIKEGDTVVAKITEVQSILGSWIIEYEKVN